MRGTAVADALSFELASGYTNVMNITNFGVRMILTAKIVPLSGWSEDEGYFTIQPAISPTAITPFAPSAAPKWHKADIRSYSAGASVIREYIVATTEWPDAYHYTVAQYENKYNGNVQASSGRVYGMDQTTAISGDVDGEFRGLYLKAKSYYGR